MIWKSDLTDKMKRCFFQAAVVSILLYGCTTWTLTKRLKKKLDGNYTRMLRAILNKSWRQHPTRHQLYGHLPPITKTIKARRNRHTGHCWRSKDELISDVLLWTPAYGQAKVGRPARTYVQQLFEDMLEARHDDDDDDDDIKSVLHSPKCIKSTFSLKNGTVSVKQEVMHSKALSVWPTGGAYSTMKKPGISCSDFKILLDK